MSTRFTYGIWLLSLFLVVAWCCSVARAEDVFNASITIRGHKFEPTELRVPGLFTVINADPLSEEFDSPSLTEKVIAGNSQGIVRIAPLKPGTYEFVGEYHEETAKGRVIAE
jgi:Cupredoxin-like domain